MDARSGRQKEAEGHTGTEVVVDDDDDAVANDDDDGKDDTDLYCASKTHAEAELLSVLQM